MCRGLFIICWNQETSYRNTTTKDGKLVSFLAKLLHRGGSPAPLNPTEKKRKFSGPFVEIGRPPIPSWSMLINNYSYKVTNCQKPKCVPIACLITFWEWQQHGHFEATVVCSMHPADEIQIAPNVRLMDRWSRIGNQFNWAAFSLYLSISSYYTLHLSTDICKAKLMLALERPWPCMSPSWAVGRPNKRCTVLQGVADQRIHAIDL